MEVPSIFLNRILSAAAKKGASSLHLSVGSVPILRVDGRLLPIENENILTSDTLNKVITSFLGNKELAQLNKNKEIVIIKTFAGNFRFRVNIFYQKDLLSLSFNYIPATIRSWEDLKLPYSFKENINLDSGLLIVAGPNDSGKTSTIATLIEEINKNKKKYIITLENPIEYLFVNKKSIIEQRQIGRDVDSYITGLRHCLEEDVDLVYIDEITARATIVEGQVGGRGDEFDLAIPLILELAAGNCLVILEINAANSVRVIEKVLNAAKTKISSEAARFSLADILIGIITQRLIPSLGGGLSLATEVLLVNSAVKSLIREGKIYQLESIIQTSKEEGMISMKRSIEELIKSGKVQPKEGKRLKLDI